jgi:glycosyltransferase involved in cell wall biosynthesis
MPSVSVIMPAYNAAAYLTEAIESILAQDVQPLELLVMDDGSADATAAIAQGFGGCVRHVALAHGGLSATRNRGLAEARGDVIAFLDADDVWLPLKQSRQLALLEGADRPDIVLGYTQRLWMPSASAKSALGGVPYTTAPELAMSFGAALLRRTVFDRVGGLDATRGSTEDIDWMMRAREAGLCIHVHPEVVQYYRRHDSNMTNDLAAGRASTLLTIKKSLDRRRAGGGEAQNLRRLTESPS